MNVCRGLVGGSAPFFGTTDTHGKQKASPSYICITYILYMRRWYVRLGVKTPQVTLSSSYNLLFIDWQGVDTRRH